MNIGEPAVVVALEKPMEPLQDTPFSLQLTLPAKAVTENTIANARVRTNILSNFLFAFIVIIPSFRYVSSVWDPDKGHFTTWVPPSFFYFQTEQFRL